jgi:Fe-S-cluster containining protein
MSVGLYLPEAFALADLLTDAQYTRVAEHAERVYHYACDTSDYLTGFRFSEIGFCPFLDLDRGTCCIYEHRPANCRHVFSNMPPEYCAKDIVSTLDHDPQRRTEFLRQLDPDVNEDELPFIAPLLDIFYEKYEIYLMILTSKYFNFNMYGEMSWFITLAREHHLWDVVTGPEDNLAYVTEKLQKTGLYHEYMLTDCQKILPHFKEQSIETNFTLLP